MVIAGDIAYSEINAFFDDHFITANIGHINFLFILKQTGALIFSLDGIHQYIICLFREGKEAQLRIIKCVLDKMELDQHFLTQQLSAVKKYLVILEVVDILQL